MIGMFSYTILVTLSKVSDENFGKILIITPTNAQLVFIIYCLPTCFDLYRSSCRHTPLNTNNQIQDSVKIYYIHTQTHVTLNVLIIRKKF